MENQAGYDLNAAVEKWRQELAVQPGFTADERRELETHLRDAISGFQERGLDDEESFWLARRRVGQPQELGEEFAKTDPAKIWRERVFWMVLALFLSGTLSGIPNSVYMCFNPGSPSFLFEVLYLVPVVIIVSLGMGKMTGLFSKLTQLISGRFRLASAALILVLTSSTLNYFRVVIWYKYVNAENAKIGIHLPPFQYPFSLVRGFEEILPLLVLALLLIWLLPKRNRKQLRSASLG